MEWVVTTAKTVDEAKSLALDQLGVAADEAEFDVVEEPRTGLFGRVKVEARVRARVKPTPVRPKQDRRDRRRSGGGKKRKRSEGRSGSNGANGSDGSGGERDGAQLEMLEASESTGSASSDRGSENGSADASSSDRSNGQADAGRQRSKRQRARKEKPVTEVQQESDVSPEEVGQAAAAFMTGLADAFGSEATAEVDVDGTEIDVRLTGPELGLLVGPGGRTLTAVQDLARVASQRRLGDHDTRLRIDVGGYREKRRQALEKFAVAVANQVIESGAPKALEPMSSADRKAVHDALTGIDGVSSRSEGDDPDRRVVISPA